MDSPSVFPLLVLALATLGGPARAVGASIVSVPLSTVGRSPLVEVTVDGRATVRLMVDPGNETVLAEALVEELGLTVDEEGRAFLPNIEIGGVDLGSVWATTWTPSPVSPGAPVPDGFLAVSVFSEHLLTLDYGRGRLGLEDGTLPAPDGREILAGGVAAGSALSVPVRIGSVTLDARLDAGAAGDFTLPIEYRQRLPLADEPGRIGRTIDDDGREVDILGARLDGSARIGEHEIARPGLVFSEAFSEAMIGFDALAHFAITFDQRTHRIRFRADADHGAFLEAAAARVPALEPGADPLRDFFNANADRVHLMVLLSPT